MDSENFFFIVVHTFLPSLQKSQTLNIVYHKQVALSFLKSHWPVFHWVLSGTYNLLQCFALYFYIHMVSAMVFGQKPLLYVLLLLSFFIKTERWNVYNVESLFVYFIDLVLFLNCIIAIWTDFYRSWQKWVLLSFGQNVKVE